MDVLLVLNTPKVGYNHHSFLLKSKRNILKSVLPIKLFIIHGKLTLERSASLKKNYFTLM